ncbi:MAG: FG-GAP repeat domain-containing protein [Planctomycetaceae bacterium]
MNAHWTGFVVSAFRQAKGICSAVLIVAANFCPLMAQDAPSDLAQYYGFTGVEIYELHERAAGLVSGDFNGDDRIDLAVVDNFASSIRLFMQRQEPGQETNRADVNQILSDQRFQERSITLDRAVADIAAADLNADGRTDLAVFGAPDQLAIYLQPEASEGEWKKTFSARISDVEPAGGILAAGDLNGDQRTDLAVLGKDFIQLFSQQEDGEWGASATLMNSLQRPGLLQAADLNGDGRTDLAYVSGDSGNRVVCARLQSESGRSGPELIVSRDQILALTLANVDAAPGMEFLTVDARTRRVRISRITTPEIESDRVPGLVRYGLGDGGAARDRAVVTADFDGDGGVDVLASNHEQAEMLLYRQEPVGGPGLAESYPTLLGITDVAAADLNGDGKPEAILLSSKEKVVAVSSFTDGRMAFPRTIIQQPDDWELAAVAAVPVSGSTALVIAVTQGSGRSGKLKFIRCVRDQSGKWVADEEGDESVLTGAVGQRGLRLVPMDVNGDDRIDLLSIASGSAVDGFHVLLQSEDGTFAVTAQNNQLDAGVTSAGRVFVSDRQLLVARDSFARMLSWETDGWDVADQFNAADSGSDVSAVASLDLDGQGDREIILVDTGVNRLRVLRKQESVYRSWKEADLGGLTVSSTLTADLNRDGREDLILVGREQMAVLFAGSAGHGLQEISLFDPSRERFSPVDVLAGDLNSDGVADLVVIDNSINGLSLVNLSSDLAMREATYFRVFEEKRLVSTDQRGGVEPREGLIVDVTGDGRADLVLLCHDRLLVYPQDTGTSSGSETDGR